MPEPASVNAVLPEMHNFYNELKDIQKKYVTDCRYVTKKPIALKWSGADPLIHLEQPVFEADRLREIFDEISLLIAAHLPKAKSDMDRIAELPGQSVLNLLEAAMSGSIVKAGGDLDRNINIDFLKFIVLNSVKPFLKAFAGGITHRTDIGAWRKNFCPVCGSSPHIGRITGDGKKYLCCSLCETEWQYKRLACYNCGNENHNTLSFLFIDETPGYGLDVCEECKVYIKIVDEQKGGKAEVMANEAATLYLDVVARRKGYRHNMANS